MTVVVAAHQPTFLPWLGWWDKLARADVLILLDEVQFPKKGGTWMNRGRILVQGSPAWLTVPVDRSYHGLRTMRETLVDDTKPWRKKVAKTIEASYRRAPHFDDVFPLIQDSLRHPTNQLTEINENGIIRIAARLEIDTHKLIRQSELSVGGNGTDLLVELCKAVGGTDYLTGDGADEYLEPEKFAAAQLGLERQRFTPPTYPQASAEYVPGLLVVDALMNCGWEGTANILTQRPRDAARSTAG